MWFIGVEVEQETSAPPPKKNPGSAPVVVLCSRPPQYVKFCIFTWSQSRSDGKEMYKKA